MNRLTYIFGHVVRLIHGLKKELVKRKFKKYRNLKVSLHSGVFLDKLWKGNLNGIFNQVGQELNGRFRAHVYFTQLVGSLATEKKKRLDIRK